MEEQQKEVINWINGVLGEEYSGFVETLKSGVVLCRLLNKVTGMNIKYKESKQFFVQMENICSFISGLKKLGINEYELFQTVDLYEEKDIKQVVICLYALSRHLQKEKIISGPFIGPRLAKKNKIVITEKMRNLSKCTVSLQMGYDQGYDPLLDKKD